MRYHSPDHNDKYFDEDHDDDDDFDDVYHEESKQLKLAELALVEFNLNRRILGNVVKMLENSFWWRFLSYKTKLNMIRNTYHELNNLIEDRKEK